MPSIASVNMEDRHMKRPAADDQARSGPPTKRQHVAVNGTSAHPDADMPWREDIEEYQKDAILRQMKEYKREVASTKEELKRVAKKALYHDDHLRIIDAWFSQLIDELSSLSNAPLDSSDTLFPLFNSSLFSADQEAFKSHLGAKSEQIKSSITPLLARISAPASDMNTLQEKCSKLLAAEKSRSMEVERLTAEYDQLHERWEAATTRYLKSEKKMDRLKSSQVAKLEAQAVAAAKPEPDEKSDIAVKREDAKEANGVSEEERRGSDSGLKEALALAQKRSEQVERLSLENKNLTQELTTMKMKYTALSDDDFSRTELFKSLKSQREDLTKQLNDLEASNNALRTDAKRLNAERTDYRGKVYQEEQARTDEMARTLTQAEANLSRVRNQRDEYLAELQERKAKEEVDAKSHEQSMILSNARNDRIAALESELQRLRPDQNANVLVNDDPGALQELDAGSLRTKLQTSEKEKSMLEAELKSMEAAWRKASSAANTKVAAVSDAEDRIAKAVAEKAKADQKYFAAMKAKEHLQADIKTQKSHNARASEIVTQLKEAESTCRQQVAQTEKQLADAKDSLGSCTHQQRDLQRKLTDQKASADQLASQIEELKKLTTTKDASASEASRSRLEAENKVSELQVQLDQAEKNLESWRKRASTGNSEEFEVLRVSFFPIPASTVSKPTSLLTRDPPEHCNMQRMPQRIQVDSYQDMWACILPRLCERTAGAPVAKMSKLWERLWEQRSAQDHSLIHSSSDHAQFYTVM